jgi:FAD/FMN-containing dehydrogenase
VVQVKPMEYLALRPKVEALVYGPLAECNGSVSAEHGIGLEKKPYLHLSRSPAELAVMKTLKTALDPKGLLNPGKIF